MPPTTASTMPTSVPVDGPLLRVDAAAPASAADDLCEGDLVCVGVRDSEPRLGDVVGVVWLGASVADAVEKGDLLVDDDKE